MIDAFESGTRVEVLIGEAWAPGTVLMGGLDLDGRVHVRLDEDEREEDHVRVLPEYVWPVGWGRNHD